MYQYVVIKSNNKYGCAFDANLNVIKHNAMKALELSITKYLLSIYKIKYLVLDYKLGKIKVYNTILIVNTSLSDPFTG